MTHTSIRQRPLGRSDLTVSSIGLGCVTFGREIDEETSRRILDYALAKGINFFDTAESYGAGNIRESRRQRFNVHDVREVTEEMHSSEKILGRWIHSRGCRDQIVVCTKVSSGNDPENVRRQLLRSLERLGVDCVDVYELHKPDDEVPITETLEALNEEVSSGQVRAIGCSNFSARQLRDAISASTANGWRRFEVVQPPYSLIARDIERELLPLCQTEQIAVTTYSPLAAGFLSGKYTPDRSKLPADSRFHVAPGHANIYFNDDNFRAVERLRKNADELGLPMVRLAMAWVMSNPDVTSVLVGARSTQHVDNALLAAEMGLDPALRARIVAGDGERPA